MPDRGRREHGFIPARRQEAHPHRPRPVVKGTKGTGARDPGAARQLRDADVGQPGVGRGQQVIHQHRGLSLPLVRLQGPPPVEFFLNGAQVQVPVQGLIQPQDPGAGDRDHILQPHRLLRRGLGLPQRDRDDPVIIAVPFVDGEGGSRREHRGTITQQQAGITACAGIPAAAAR